MSNEKQSNKLLALENLCSYDSRNPNFNPLLCSDFIYSKPCYCDNCFYGRTELANIMLSLIEETEETNQTESNH